MAKLSRRARRLLGVPAGIGAALVVAPLLLTGTLDEIEVATLDARLALRGERPLDPRIVVIALDDETWNLLGWPVARSVWAHAVELAAKHGAKATAFDVMFFEARDEGEDALFAAKAKACNCVVFPSQWRQEGEQVVVDHPIEVLRAASASRAHVQLDNSLDGVFRAVPLALTVEGERYPSLAVALARVAGERVATDDGKAWIAWRGNAARGASLMDLIAADDALANGQVPDLDLDALFKGSIVLFGQTAKSVGDRGAVPYSSDAPLILVHANLLDNLLNDRLTSPPGRGVALALAMLVALVIGLCATAFRAALGTGLAVAALALTWGAATLAFANAELWLPLAAPTLAAVLAYGAGGVLNVAVRDADERRLRQAFERYVAPHILDKVLQSGESIDIRGHKRQLTLLFSDIKGYTTLSNTLQPDQIVELLCGYLDGMVEIILSHEGTVDKIMGDGIMAFFGDPLPQKDHALRSIKAALDMQRAVGKMGEKWVERGLSPLQVRIGVATGEVFVGSIGSRHHLEYTAIGRPVNLAARLEGKAPPGGVLISQETYELVKDEVVTREVRGLDLKGYSGGYDAWLVLGLAGTELPPLQPEQRGADRRPFFSDVVLEVHGVDLAARSHDVSPGGMFVVCDGVPPPATPVRLRARLAKGGDAPVSVQMDAVVTHVRHGKEGGSGAGVMFTTVYADDAVSIRALLDGVIGGGSFEDARVQPADGARGKLSYAIETGPIETTDDE
ncbi:MAG: CHASE2 domain-containing protein [Deltaproteobacteria bacterium]|nr:CHASE2 domain-containing protein [Deltaproteobacteria bacterium]